MQLQSGAKVGLYWRQWKSGANYTPLPRWNSPSSSVTGSVSQKPGQRLAAAEAALLTSALSILLHSPSNLIFARSESPLKLTCSCGVWCVVMTIDRSGEEVRDALGGGAL